MEQKNSHLDLSQSEPITSTITDTHQSWKNKYIITLLLGIFFVSSLFITIYSLLSKQSDIVSHASENMKQQSSGIKTFKRRKEVIGFLPSWSMASKSPVNTEHLTQLIYFGLAVTDDGNIVKRTTDNQVVAEWEQFTSKEFTHVRQTAKSEGVKIVVSIKNFDNTEIDKLTSNRIATSTFIKQMKQLIKDYNLDGINFDFEYFTDSEFPTVKYLNTFLETVNTELKKENPKMLISIDINASVVLYDHAYDMVRIGTLVDQVIVMGYDYTRAQSTKAGPVAPLFATGEGQSINKTITSLIGRVPSEKIILALPFYGYEWQTLNKKIASDTVNNSGAVATYKRVQELLAQRDDIEKSWDEESQTPRLVYVQSGAIKQIYYDDAKSFAAKLQYAQKQKLAGIGIWALGYEGDTQDLWKEIGKYEQ